MPWWWRPSAMFHEPGRLRWVPAPVGAPSPATAERSGGQNSSGEPSPGEFCPLREQDSMGEPSLVEFGPTWGQRSGGEPSPTEFCPRPTKRHSTPVRQPAARRLPPPPGASRRLPPPPAPFPKKNSLPLPRLWTCGQAPAVGPSPTSVGTLQRGAQRPKRLSTNPQPRPPSRPPGTRHDATGRAAPAARAGSENGTTPRGATSCFQEYRACRGLRLVDRR